MATPHVSAGSRSLRIGVVATLAVLVASSFPLPLSSAAELPSYPIGADQVLPNAGVNTGYVIACPAGGCAANPSIQRSTTHVELGDGDPSSQAAEALVGYRFKLHRACAGQSTLAPFTLEYDYGYTYSEQRSSVLVRGGTTHTVKARVFADDTLFTTAVTTQGSGSGTLQNLDVDVDVGKTYEASLASHLTASFADTPLVEPEWIKADATVTQGTLKLVFTDPLDPEVTSTATVPSAVNGDGDQFLGYINQPEVRFLAQARDPAVNALGQNVIQSCVKEILFGSVGKPVDFSQAAVTSDPVTGEGRHATSIRAVDNKERVSAPKAVNFIIDTVDPVTELNVTPFTPLGKANWYNKYAPAHWVIKCERDPNPGLPLAEDTAPCDKTEVKENTAPAWTNLGAGATFADRRVSDGHDMRLDARSTDRANNVNDIVSTWTIDVDTVDPIPKVTRTTESDFRNGWHNDPTVLTIACDSDATSGCGIVESRTDNGAWTGQTTYSCNTDQLYDDLDWAVEDIAGNRIGSTEFFGCDFVAPLGIQNLRITSPLHYNATLKVNYSNVNPVFEWDDAIDPVTNGVASNINHYEIVYGGVTHRPTDNRFEFSGIVDGWRCLTVRPVDNANNSGPVSSPVCVFIDRVKPDVLWNLPAPGKLYHNGNEVMPIVNAPLTDGAVVVGDLFVSVTGQDFDGPGGREASKLENVHLIQDAGVPVDPTQPNAYANAPAICEPDASWSGDVRLDGDGNCDELCDGVYVNELECGWEDDLGQSAQTVPSVDTRLMYSRVWDQARNVNFSWRNYTRVDLGVVETVCSIGFCNTLYFSPAPGGIDFLTYLIERRIPGDANPLLADWHLLTSQPSVSTTTYTDPAMTSVDKTYEYRVSVLDSAQQVAKAYNRVRIQPTHVRGYVGEMYVS